MVRASGARSVMTAMMGAILALTFASPSWAHGPTRQKVVEKTEINAPAAKVWDVIGNYQDWTWHPSIDKSEGAGGNDKDATRKLTLSSGGVVEEKLLKHDAERTMLKYEITKVDVKVLPVNNYSATMTIAEEGGKSVVTWKGAFYRGFLNNDPPPELSDEAAVNAITGFYKSGLEALKKKVEGGN